MSDDNDQTPVLSRQEFAMKKLLSSLLAAVFVIGSVNAIACPGDKAKDEKQMSTPGKTKV